MKTYILITALLLSASNAIADDAKGFLETTHHHATMTSTIPSNGDMNPYALIVAPVTSGLIQKNDVLIDNFNNASNLQGTGTTIVDYNPSTKTMSQIANIPKDIKGCPGRRWTFHSDDDAEKRLDNCWFNSEHRRHNGN